MMGVEDIAKIIDPEAWDLPDNTEPGTITDRDIARDRARIIFYELETLRERCEAYKAQVEAGAKEIERLKAAQWPEEVTDEMTEAVYRLKLGNNHLSEDDVIDIYDTFRRIVSQHQARQEK